MNATVIVMMGIVSQWKTIKRDSTQEHARPLTALKNDWIALNTTTIIITIITITLTTTTAAATIATTTSTTKLKGRTRMPTCRAR